MKAKVLIQFYDKETKTTRKKGDIFDVAPVRFNEIIRKGNYIEAIDEAAEKKATEKK